MGRLKLSSSSVPGKNTSSSVLRLDFFRFSLNDRSRFFFLSFGETGDASSGGVTPSPGLRGPGLAGNVPDMSLWPAAAPSLRVAARWSSLLSFSGDFNLNRLLTLSEPDLLMVCGAERSGGPRGAERSPTTSCCCRGPSAAAGGEEVWSSVQVREVQLRKVTHRKHFRL